MTEIESKRHLWAKPPNFSSLCHSVEHTPKPLLYMLPLCPDQHPYCPTCLKHHWEPQGSISSLSFVLRTRWSLLPGITLNTAGPSWSQEQPLVPQTNFIIPKI